METHINNMTYFSLTLAHTFHLQHVLWVATVYCLDFILLLIFIPANFQASQLFSVNS